MADVTDIADALPKSAKLLLCAQLWAADDPSNPWLEPALACDVKYHGQRVLLQFGLVEKINDFKGTNWLKLTPRGIHARQRLEARNG